MIPEPDNFKETAVNVGEEIRRTAEAHVITAFFKWQETEVSPIRISNLTLWAC